MKNIAEIKTRISPNLSNRKQRISELKENLTRLAMEDLRMYYLLFLGEKPKGLNKTSMLSALSIAMAFKDEKTFRDWFFSLPVFTRSLLHRLSFDNYVPVEKLEKEFDLSLAHQSSTYYWEEKWAFHEELGIGFLHIYTQYDKAFVVLPQILRMILIDWLVPPPDFSIESCVFSGDAAGTVWDNSGGVIDSLPLLCEALADFFGRMKPPESPFRYIRGFKKNDVEGLRASSAFKPFDVPAFPAEAENPKARGRPSAGLKSGDLVPESVDLTARFLLAMKNFSITRPKDAQDEVKKLVSAFFSDKSQYKDYVNPPDRHSLEFNVLFDHISKPSEYSLRYEGELPYSRKIFRDIITFCAKDGGTFDADKVARFIYRSAQYFSFYFNDTERYLKYRANSITVDGTTFSSRYNSDFYPTGVLQYHLLTAPLLKAYCYLFAALGLLEISQAAPPLPRVQNEKQRPLSPYDSLKSFRVTEFGKWCLGLTEKRPERPKAEYQAIADKELFLVTVQGNSLERTVYLNKIGRRLGGQAEKGSGAEAGFGTDRWRVSPDSFISGCTDKNQIADRVEKFKALIDPAPAPHWLALFEKALNRAGLFDRPLGDMLVYPLPADRSVAEELLRDTELRSLVHRAEGGLLVVPEKNRKKFFTLLNAHGIAVFEA
ncbi:MAG: hypothetical protein LBR93_06185 [Treponema sp.]|jgi:hypothetical protein|nr:hypothetical protein [Treponema sp.]